MEIPLKSLTRLGSPLYLVTNSVVCNKMNMLRKVYLPSNQELNMKKAGMLTSYFVMSSVMYRVNRFTVRTRWTVSNR